MDDVKVFSFETWACFDSFLRAGLEQQTTKDQVKYIYGDEE
jgi:hypothetical protein